MLHVLCTGFWPYSATTEEELSEFIAKGKTKLLLKKLPDNPDLIELLQGMLQYVPENRYTIEEILDSAWLDEGEASTRSTGSVSSEIPPVYLSSNSAPNLAEIPIFDHNAPPEFTSEQLSSTDDPLIISPRGVRAVSSKKKTFSPKTILNRLKKFNPRMSSSKS